MSVGVVLAPEVRCAPHCCDRLFAPLYCDIHMALPSPLPSSLPPAPPLTILYEQLSPILPKVVGPMILENDLLQVQLRPKIQFSEVVGLVPGKESWGRIITGEVTQDTKKKASS
jgi:hypothetical protein